MEFWYDSHEDHMGIRSSGRLFGQTHEKLRPKLAYWAKTTWALFIAMRLFHQADAIDLLARNSPSWFRGGW